MGLLQGKLMRYLHWWKRVDKLLMWQHSFFEHNWNSDKQKQKFFSNATKGPPIICVFTSETDGLTGSGEFMTLNLERSMKILMMMMMMMNAMKLVWSTLNQRAKRFIAHMTCPLTNLHLMIIFFENINMNNPTGRESKTNNENPTENIIVTGSEFVHLSSTKAPIKHSLIGNAVCHDEFKSMSCHCHCIASQVSFIGYITGVLSKRFLITMLLWGVNNKSFF